MGSNDIHQTVISSATSRNWKRLRTKGSGRLMSRANKRLSTRTILPVEYFLNKDNIIDIQQFVALCKQKNYKVENVIYSVGVELLRKTGILVKPHVQKVLKEYSRIRPVDIDGCRLPADEFDLLGLIYQCFLLEGEKNRKGSYYTPWDVARNMTAGLDFSKNLTFFDPCCGSGAFILALEGAGPSQVFGCDNDPVAVMAAKINLLLKYKTQSFEPQIICCDYLNKNFKSKYTYIVGNPPWGAVIFDTKGKPVTTKESFSFFFEKAFGQLEDDGMMRFLLPESILNVKCHRNFRQFLLEHCCLKSITRYPGTFSGVQTKFIDIAVSRNGRQDGCGETLMNVSENSISRQVSTASFRLTDNLNFNLLSSDDYHKVRKILSKGKYTLRESIWALGVITGDNKNKVKNRQGRGMEPIYTGREIEAYTLKQPTKFIKYERSDFQQVAKDEIYRADEKLVYKFISKNLVFAYDNSRSLFLNSANILIPRIPGMSIKTVLAFLNSELFKFLYKSLFGEIKILKGNLLELPFPEITPETDKKLTNLVNEVLKGNKEAIKEIDEVVSEIFQI